MNLLIKIISTTNIWAIITAVAAFFLLAAIWFFAFGKLWSSELEKHGVKISESAQSGMAGKFIGTLIMQIIIVCGCRLISYMTNIETAGQAIKLGLAVGICFAAAPIIIAALCESRPVKLALLDIGYPVLGTTISMVIVSLWR